ncbi:peptidoglycan editing factor PgeF [Paraburkholderia sp.]|uniref:peptidoglycan editing factor PgeF n=1 Tax=Paraburkholderia sp. TaxID=1926495 RepID=UPI002394EFBB|nr:peptidoglycan editing factor PgeF [Paraburkholderia sp.]MDE1184158.1 peptidoglycan editing factor PgeF [Paraburkholderia sp.]
MTLPDLTPDDVLQPAWNAASRVHALVTTRNGGVGQPPYGRWHDGVDQPGGLNLGRLAGDEPASVEANRARLGALIDAAGQAGQAGHADRSGNVAIAWLEQIHGADVVRAEDVVAATQAGNGPTRADASVTDRPGIACTVMIADCMPVLFCDPDGRAVGAAHAGWRGLAGGIVEKTAQRVAALAGVDVSTLHAYLGPAIGPTAFEVGADVRDAFMNAVDAAQRDATSNAFVPRDGAGGKYLADLPGLGRLRLQSIGISRIVSADACTVTQRERFFSYRRDRVTGRMAALIWITD